MYVEQSLKNIRCDTAACHKRASYNISTSGYKGNIYLCEDCFNKLYSAMQKIKKTAKQTQVKKGDN